MGITKKVLKVVGIIGFVVGILLLSFLLTAAVIYGACWAFDLTFSWKMAFGIWLVLSLLSSQFKTVIHEDKFKWTL